ncbi:MAG: zinc-ribbon domain-containing protein [Ruminococcus sp.]
MICPNCNKEIKDDSKFCIFCGANVQAQNKQSQPQVNPAQSVQTQQSNMPPQSELPVQNFQPANTNTAPANQPAMPKKPMNKKLLFGIIGGGCALVVIIAVAAVLIVTHKNKINLNDYVTVKFKGYDTYGEASVNFDYDKYYTDLQNSSSSFKDAYNNNGGWSLISDYYEMTDALHYSIDKTEGLTNGDTVTVSFEYDNEAAAKFKLEFVGEPKEVTVEGLKEVKKIDPFDGVTLEFSGTSPNAYAKVVKGNTDTVYSHIYYDLSKSSGIKVGDKITVTVTNDPEYFVQDYGCAFTTTSKEFECKSVDRYISKLAEIKDDTLNSMKKQTEDVINAYFANNSKYIGLSDLKFEGTYLLVEKEGTWGWDGNNQLYVIFSGKVKSNEEKNKFDETTVYFPVRFKDIIEYADGTQYVDLNSTRISGETSLKFSYYEVKGYTDKAVMYNELVTSQKADYTEEITDGLK